MSLSSKKWSFSHVNNVIEFNVRHLMIFNIKGSFKIFDASIYTSGKDFTTAVIDLWIDVTSINTGDEIRDKYLQGADFFDALSHKQINFTSSTIGLKDDNGNHELWGELTMKGKKRNVKLSVIFRETSKDSYGVEKTGFTVEGVIKRSDFGLIWSGTLGTSGMVLSDEVTISCDIELIEEVTPNELFMTLESDDKQV